jgi:hypothetical protein
VLYQSLLPPQQHNHLVAWQHCVGEKTITNGGLLWLFSKFRIRTRSPKPFPFTKSNLRHPRTLFSVDIFILCMCGHKRSVDHDNERNCVSTSHRTYLRDYSKTRRLAIFFYYFTICKEEVEQLKQQLLRADSQRTADLELKIKQQDTDILHANTKLVSRLIK